MSEPITIVGGGVAGLALGIGLRQQGVPVTVWEAGRYPRHHVCGEFISGAGQRSLERLGLLERLRAAGAQLATEALFFAGRRQVARVPLRQAAVCVSRYVLDAWLAAELARLGGELRAGQRWPGGVGAGEVRASGRRSEPPADGWRLFGLKIHARGLQLAADLEMHVVPQGYVGLCRLAGGEVNICGLFRSRGAATGLRQQWREWLGGAAGSVLRQRLDAATIDETSLCAVAGFSLRPRRAAEQDECCIGDALTMIPPVTGNGMSMAFESAELAVGPLVAYSQGALSWEAARAAIAAACDERFRRRLRWAWWLQWALFQPLARETVLAVAGRSQRLTQAVLANTR
jgi:flavin-dependent dehydrogenase